MCVKFKILPAHASIKLNISLKDSVNFLPIPACLFCASQSLSSLSSLSTDFPSPLTILNNVLTKFTAVIVVCHSV